MTAVGHSGDLYSAVDAVAVTPSDSTVLSPPVRALYIGVTGDVAVRMASGNTATFKATAVGILPIQADKILATGTTATNILALY